MNERRESVEGRFIVLPLPDFVVDLAVADRRGERTVAMP